MKHDWFCMDCHTTVELNRWGFCATCGSDSVDIAVRPMITADSLAVEAQEESARRS